MAALTAAHPEVPAHTTNAIAIIETNAPEYLASSDKADRYRRLDGYITLEAWRLKADTDMRGYWYEFIEAKAPELTESEIDAIARHGGATTATGRKSARSAEARKKRVSVRCGGASSSSGPETKPRSKPRRIG